MVPHTAGDEGTFALQSQRCEVSFTRPDPPPTVKVEMRTGSWVDYKTLLVDAGKFILLRLYPTADRVAVPKYTALEKDFPYAPETLAIILWSTYYSSIRSFEDAKVMVKR